MTEQDVQKFQDAGKKEKGGIIKKIGNLFGIPSIPKKVLVMGASFIVALFIVITLFSQIFSTVDSGTYHIKQAAITGTMTAKMVPGMYGLLFGSNEIWPKAETYYFTADRDTREDVAEDLSIEVRFNDGSIARISGTIRVILPNNEEEAIELVTKSGYRSYRALRDKLILPTLRNAIRNTANLMSSRESYSTNRSDFVNWSWDQIQNGVYETEEESRMVADEITGEEIKRTFKVIRKDGSGNIIRGKNPLLETGINLANFEVKQFRYSSAVSQQIETQQKAFMAVATAVAEAKQAEQEKIKVEAQGKKEVTIAKYEKEQEKIRAVTDAEKDKRVAELKAEKELAVARLERQAAGETKQKFILLGEGEAARKKLVMAADGALKQKLEAWLQSQQYWAQAYQSRAVPSYYIAGGGDKGAGSPDMQSQQFMSFINAMMAKQLGLDLEIKKGSK